jgi:hypothetical protein
MIVSCSIGVNRPTAAFGRGDAGHFGRGFNTYDPFTRARRGARTCCSWSPPDCGCPACNALAVTPTYPRSPRGISTPGTLNEARWRVTKHQVIIVRVVEYQITNRETTGEAYRLITTITDWQDALAPTWAAAYHHRREFEIALDEIETHQISHSRVLRWTFPS